MLQLRCVAQCALKRWSNATSQVKLRAVRRSGLLTWRCGVAVATVAPSGRYRVSIGASYCSKTPATDGVRS